MAMSNITEKLEDVIFKAFEEEVKRIASEIVGRHKEAMEKELNAKTAEIVSKLGMKLSKHMSIQTLSDKVIIEIFDQRKP